MLNKIIEEEVKTFITEGIKKIETLNAEKMVEEAAINPFLAKALGFTDFDTLSRFFVYQRIGRSLVTSFGMTVMEKFVKELGGGKKGQWWDFKIPKGVKILYVSVKSGPRDMDKDQAEYFCIAAKELIDEDPNALPRIAMCYGWKPLGLWFIH